MILCPKCNKLAYINTYFGTYSCSNCDWKDDWFRNNRHKLSGELNIWSELNKHVEELYKQ